MPPAAPRRGGRALLGGPVRVLRPAGPPGPPSASLRADRGPLPPSARPSPYGVRRSRLAGSPGAWAAAPPGPLRSPLRYGPPGGLPARPPLRSGPVGIPPVLPPLRYARRPGVPCGRFAPAGAPHEVCLQYSCYMPIFW